MKLKIKIFFYIYDRMHDNDKYKSLSNLCDCFYHLTNSILSESVLLGIFGIISLYVV